MEIKAIKCPSCGANLEYDGSATVLYCQYCGTKIAVDGIKSEQHIVNDAEIRRLDLRQQRHEERVERHEKRHEEHVQRREKRHEALRSLLGLKD